MTSFFDSGPLPDFKEIQKWLGKELPWKLAEQWERANDNSWLNQYVQNILESSKRLPRREEERTIRTETSKDEKHVLVRLALPPNASQKEIRLFATADRLKITGLPDGRNKIVRLPCLILPRSGKAAWKNGRMTVKFRRRPVDRDEVELFIRS
ncbi:hypothetical protein J19TS2_13990 [Cohnella xylanilytica]|uniref:HSP20 family molecular chaperone IbpA n=1 Tax=Cohnella xylanilytica TaxID=557555 RepID=A0A841U2F9_9BACL|nr:hypothetical protein [Cohnella xylanilytica]MBB6692301.1 hypothetical protein [Cohnella xylanilytica]GIO11844.1 hypothetical protein J19TS2_13990 [Cohnella xylanilytica]